MIDQPWVFIGGVLVLKARDDLKSGEYQFSKSASLRDVVDTIIDGKVVQHALTIPEGLTSEQIVAAAAARTTRSPATSRKSRAKARCCRRPTSSPAARRASRSIQRMQQAQQRVLQEVWERRIARPADQDAGATRDARLDRREGDRQADERTRVAAVFVNRLKQKMRLQSDPTIIYGLVGGKGTLGRPILKSEIEQPTPYNTYVIDGLPPGPIANPGRASLEAAANPARTKELYFVADGTGGHVFAENYEQHQKNVARLRALEQQTAQPNGAAEPTAPACAASRDRHAKRVR